MTVVATRIIGQTDLVVAGAALDMNAVTVYSVGAMLIYYSNGFLKDIQYSMFPPLQKAIAVGDLEDARRLFGRSVQMGLLFGLLPFVGAIMFAEPFITLWMGGPSFNDTSVSQAATVMALLAASKLSTIFVGGSEWVLNAAGRVRIPAALAVLEAVINLALSILFVLVMDWGLAGIALGTLSGRLLVGTFIAPWFCCRTIGLSFVKHSVHFGGLELVAGVVLAGICLCVRHLIADNSWVAFFLQIALVTILYVPVAYWLLISSADRRRVCDVFASWRTVGQLGR